MENRTKYRLQPCLSCDVEGMQAWLESLAKDGFLLAKDGFFAGFGQCYEQKSDYDVRYRLIAREKPTTLFTDRESPEDEALDLAEHFGWEFVARRDEFYIYRSTRADAREPETDPQVRAIALNSVKKRKRANFFASLLWLAVIPLIYLRLGMVRTALAVGSPLFILALFVMISTVFSGFSSYLSVRKLWKRLKNDEPYEPAKPQKSWRKFARIASTVASLVCVVSLIFLPIANASREDTPIAEYPGNPPFATLSAFGEGYEADEFGWTNDFDKRSDLLAETSIEWSEHGELTLADGSRCTAIYDVEYHELRAEPLARLLAWEIATFDRWEGAENPHEISISGVDSAVWYRSGTLHSEVVVVRVGREVVRASIYDFDSTGATGNVDVETFAQTIADSLGG